LKAKLTELGGQPVLTLVAADKKDADFCRSLTKELIERGVISIRTAGKRAKKIQVIRHSRNQLPIKHTVLYTLRIDAPQALREKLAKQLQSSYLVGPVLTAERNGVEFGFNKKLFIC